MKNFYEITSIVKTYIEAEDEDKACEKFDNDDYIVQNKVATSIKRANEETVQKFIKEDLTI